MFDELGLLQAKHVLLLNLNAWNSPIQSNTYYADTKHCMIYYVLQDMTFILHVMYCLTLIVCCELIQTPNNSVLKWKTYQKHFRTYNMEDIQLTLTEWGEELWQLVTVEVTFDSYLYSRTVAFFFSLFFYRLIGLVVKVSALRVADLGFHSRLPQGWVIPVT